MGDDHEAERLAEEVVHARDSVDARREGDLERLSREQSARDVARGKREGHEEAHTAKQDEQLVSLQEMYSSVLTELRGMNTRLEKLETTFGLWVSAAKDAANAGVGARQFWLGVAAICVTIGVALAGKHI